MFALNKLSLIVITRCNLRCKLCCEFVPQNKAFPDMTAEQAKQILTEAFRVVDHIKTLHLTGGGEPFLHRQLPQLVEAAMEHQSQFDRLMLFTNSTVPPSDELLDVIRCYKDRILVQMSLYHVKPEREAVVSKLIAETGVSCKIVKYYGDEQSFGGWVDFGKWERYHRTEEELAKTFANCGITRDLHGNWRTRDGKVHWCTRSKRGMELGFIPDNPDDYVDLLDSSESIEKKREKFRRIENASYLSSCDYCSGDMGTQKSTKRFPAAEQQ